ncbi:hypothetical protein V6N13_092186 [Hibiscus sabdariffa]
MGGRRVLLLYGIETDSQFVMDPYIRYSWLYKLGGSFYSSHFERVLLGSFSSKPVVDGVASKDKVGCGVGEMERLGCCMNAPMDLRDIRGITLKIWALEDTNDLQNEDSVESSKVDVK